MSFRRVLLVCASVMLPLLGACGTSDEATSVIDPSTGEPVAINYPKDARFVDVPEVLESRQAVIYPPVDGCTERTDPECYPPPCDPINDFGCEPCPRDNPAAWCYVPPCTAADGLINTYSSVRVGLEPNATLEVSSLAGTRCSRQVVTGIGGHIISDSNYDGLQVEYRQPYADGTLGPRTIVRTGKNAGVTPEAWASVPDGYAIVGVAAGQQGTHDLRTLIVYYRHIELTTSGVRMTGPVYQINAGVNPYGSINAQYINYNDNNVFVGVGFSSAVEQTKTIAAYIGTLP